MFVAKYILKKSVYPTICWHQDTYINKMVVLSNILTHTHKHTHTHTPFPLTVNLCALQRLQSSCVLLYPLMYFYLQSCWNCDSPPPHLPLTSALHSKPCSKEFPSPSGADWTSEVHTVDATEVLPESVVHSGGTLLVPSLRHSTKSFGIFRKQWNKAMKDDYD